MLKTNYTAKENAATTNNKLRGLDRSSKSGNVAGQTGTGRVGKLLTGRVLYDRSTHDQFRPAAKPSQAQTTSATLYSARTNVRRVGPMEDNGDSK